MVSHGSRAAINTPIQGGAADVAMVAMIGIVRSPLLKKLGWKLLLQVRLTAADPFFVSWWCRRLCRRGGADVRVSSRAGLYLVLHKTLYFFGG